eukprot:3926041-Pyramimonas_sp.AAC.1
MMRYRAGKVRSKTNSRYSYCLFSPPYGVGRVIGVSPELTISRIVSPDFTIFTIPETQTIDMENQPTNGHYHPQQGTGPATVKLQIMDERKGQSSCPSCS